MRYVPTECCVLGDKLELEDKGLKKKGVLNKNKGVLKTNKEMGPQNNYGGRYLFLIPHILFDTLYLFLRPHASHAHTPGGCPVCRTVLIRDR